MLSKIAKRLSGMQLIAGGFCIIIFIGAFLLMLPFATKSGEHICQRHMRNRPDCRRHLYALDDIWAGCAFILNPNRRSWIYHSWHLRLYDSPKENRP